MNGSHGQPDRLEWIVHPFKRSWAVALGVSILIVVIPIFVYFAYEDLWLALLTFVIMFFSLRTFYFPTRYILDDEGVAYACFPFRARRPWKAFKAYYAVEGAVRLSTFSSPSRLDAHRGFLLRYEEGGERIVDFVKSRIPEKDEGENGTRN